MTYIGIVLIGVLVILGARWLIQRRALAQGRMQRCPHCGRPYAGELTYCPSCGEVVRSGSSRR